MLETPPLGLVRYQHLAIPRPSTTKRLRKRLLPVSALFSGRLSGANVGLFFYGGHGLQVSGKN